MAHLLDFERFARGTRDENALTAVYSHPIASVEQSYAPLRERENSVTHCLAQRDSSTPTQTDAHHDRAEEQQERLRPDKRRTWDVPLQMRPPGKLCLKALSQRAGQYTEMYG